MEFEQFVAQAPVVIVCCGRRDDQCRLINLAITIDHLILAARDQGIGSCWVGALHPEPIQELLTVPGDVEVIMVVPLGYPEGSGFREVQSRKALDEIVFGEEFGRPFEA